MDRIASRTEVGGNADSPAAEGGLLTRDLSGDLPCGRCRYNLRGLSIRSGCPECGLPVRATLLAVVDPKASELRPLDRPGLIGTAFFIWALGALLAAVAVWCLRANELTVAWLAFSLPVDGCERLAPGLVALSGLGALALIRPHGGIPQKHVALAVVGVLCYPILIFLVWLLHGTYDGSRGAAYAGTGPLDGDRAVLRLAIAGLVLVVLFGLRANAVRLVNRSVVMRTGRVETQSVEALIAAVLIAAGGDIGRLLLIGGVGGGSGVFVEVGEAVTLVLIAVGSFLFTIGLFGMTIDAWRLRSVLVSPGPGLVEVFDGDDSV